MRKKRAQKWTVLPQEIERVFNEVYFTLTDSDVCEPVVIGGSRLAFDSKHYDFEIYGAIERNPVRLTLHGDIDGLHKSAILAQIERGQWQLELVFLNLSPVEVDKRQ